MTSSSMSSFRDCPLPALSDLLPELKKGNTTEFKIQVSITTSLVRGVADSLMVDLDELDKYCLLYTSPSPRDATLSRMPSSA